MRQLSEEEVRCLAFASIISADNDRYTEDVKQEVIYRYGLEKDKADKDWEFILEPLGADNRVLELFEE